MLGRGGRGIASRGGEVHNSNALDVPQSRGKGIGDHRNQKLFSFDEHLNANEVIVDRIKIWTVSEGIFQRDEQRDQDLFHEDIHLL
jgi:hypothetical protein